MNFELEVNGCILLKQNRIVQYLEGELLPIVNLWKVISMDKRHTIESFHFMPRKTNSLFSSWYSVDINDSKIDMVFDQICKLLTEIRSNNQPKKEHLILLRLEILKNFLKSGDFIDPIKYLPIDDS